MTRSMFTAALALAAALALTACASSDPEAGTASDPPVSAEPAAAVETPETEAPATVVPVESADSGAERAGPEECEPALLDLLADQQPEQGRIDDHVQVNFALDMQFPTAPTCTVSYLQGDRRSVNMVWFDAPETADAVIEGLEGQGWMARGTPTAAYIMTTLNNGSTTVEVFPIGLENPGSSIGQLWDGVDVTLVNVLLPAGTG